jgi:hypothetical protein
MKYSILLLVCSTIIIAHNANAQWANSGSAIYNTNSGDVRISPNLNIYGGNNGSISSLGALRFGYSNGSGEGIASKRTAGGNQYGLDFYTNFTNRMSITNAGNVGIGTTAPGFPLSFPNKLGDKITLWGNSGAHYGFGIQNYLLQIHTNGLAADIAFGYGSSASFTENMRIKGNGNVGIGTNLPVRKLQVNGDARLTSDSGSVGYLEFFKEGGGPLQNDWRFDNAGDGLYVSSSTDDFNESYYIARFGKHSDPFKFTVYGSAFASGGTWQNSDLKLKRDINDFSNAIDIIKQLKPKTYFFKSGEYLPLNLPGTKQYGFIAQDLEKVLPSLVQSSEEPVSINAKGERKMEEIRSVNYTALIPLLTKAIQEQQQQIEKQQQQIDELKQIISALQKGQSVTVNTGGALSKINAVTTDVILEQNIPNPASNVTSIRYYIPVSSKNAQLIITDNSGKTIKQVTLSSGQGVVNIDASVLSSSTYNYALWIDGKLIVNKKMMVSR